jgi:predicted RNA polymerase sigma factor
VSTATHDAIDRAARDSYGRLIAYLAARSGDLATAEDALGDAFRAALETWPRSGVPSKPEAWLLTAASRPSTIIRSSANIAGCSGGR